MTGPRALLQVGAVLIVLCQIVICAPAANLADKDATPYQQELQRCATVFPLLVQVPSPESVAPAAITAAQAPVKYVEQWRHSSLRVPARKPVADAVGDEMTPYWRRQPSADALRALDASSMPSWCLDWVRGFATVEELHREFLHIPSNATVVGWGGTDGDVERTGPVRPPLQPPMPPSASSVVKRATTTVITFVGDSLMRRPFVMMTNNIFLLPFGRPQLIEAVRRLKYKPYIERSATFFDAGTGTVHLVRLRYVLCQFIGRFQHVWSAVVSGYEDFALEGVHFSKANNAFQGGFIVATLGNWDIKSLAYLPAAALMETWSRGMNATASTVQALINGSDPRCETTTLPPIFWREQVVQNCSGFRHRKYDCPRLVTEQVWPHYRRVARDVLGGLAGVTILPVDFLRQVDGGRDNATGVGREARDGAPWFDPASSALCTTFDGVHLEEACMLLELQMYFSMSRAAWRLRTSLNGGSLTPQPPVASVVPNEVTSVATPSAGALEGSHAHHTVVWNDVIDLACLVVVVAIPLWLAREYIF